MQRDDGGPAFPHDGRDNGPGNIKGRPHDGMSLRDWFAGQALAGMGQWMPDYYSNGLNDSTARFDRAAWAYAQADAMIEARSK